MVTIAFEICEQLGWRPPDVIVFPTDYGDALARASKGLRELRRLGLIDRVPRGPASGAPPRRHRDPRGGPGGPQRSRAAPHAARDGRCLVTRNVADFLELVRQLINRQESHACIILVPASFRGDEFAILADAITGCATAYPQGLADQVVFLKRPVP